jgi:hypothetical protein
LCLHQQNAGLVESIVAASADTNQWYRGADLLLLRIQEPTFRKSTGTGRANTGVSSHCLSNTESEKPPNFDSERIVGYPETAPPPGFFST